MSHVDGRLHMGGTFLPYALVLVLMTKDVVRHTPEEAIAVVMDGDVGPPLGFLHPNEEELPHQAVLHCNVCRDDLGLETAVPVQVRGRGNDSVRPNRPDIPPEVEDVTGGCEGGPHDGVCDGCRAFRSGRAVD